MGYEFEGPTGRAARFIFDEPDIDCPACDGEGVDADPRGMFDFDVKKPCPQCWRQEPPK